MHIRSGSSVSKEAVLTAGKTEVHLTTKSIVTATGFFDFLRLGASHVLSGADHIAFLLALLLLARRFRSVLLAITGFTLGHSLSLALVALNILKPETRAIEALIGFTVAWTASHALYAQGFISDWTNKVCSAVVLIIPSLALLFGYSNLAWPVLLGAFTFAACMAYTEKSQAPMLASVIACVFGLVHGAGFAGPLLDMNLRGQSLLFPILSFNLGVEAGQLIALGLFAVLALGLFKFARRLQKYAFEVSASAIFGLGLFWFVSRALN